MLAMRKIRWGKYIFLVLVAGFVLVPMFATVLGGFKSLGELRTNPFGLPEVWEFEYYAQVFADGSIWLLMKKLVNYRVFLGSDYSDHWHHDRVYFFPY